MRIRILYLVSLTFLTLLSCDCEPIITGCEPNCPDIDPPLCVVLEEINSAQTGFKILDKGEQKWGTAKGVKINEIWEASVDIDDNGSGVKDRVLLSTFWKEEFKPLILGELLYLGPIPIITDSTCYELTNDIEDQERIRTRIYVNHGDIVLTEYRLDESSENNIFITDFDQQKNFKGEFSATFITDDPILPDWPEKVRLMNVEINIQK